MPNLCVKQIRFFIHQVRDHLLTMGFLTEGRFNSRMSPAFVEVGASDLLVKPLHSAAAFQHHLLRAVHL